MTSSVLKIQSKGPLQGVLKLPGDKSLAHRALIFAAMAKGQSTISNLPDSRDVLATIEALRSLGVEIQVKESRCIVEGVDGDFKEPDSPIDCKNSGTTLRLLTALCAGAGVRCSLTGDDSLSRRPMGRIIDLLEKGGAKIAGIGKPPHAPVTVIGKITNPFEVETSISSAQVKTAVLIAGMYADGRTRICQPSISRDHTERMLLALGVNVESEINCAFVNGPAGLEGFDFDLPGDCSSAAFFAAAAALIPGSEVRFERLLINPTRIGFFHLLKLAGAKVVFENHEQRLGEPTADVTVAYNGPLEGFEIRENLVPLVIDEISLAGIIAPFCSTPSRFEGVSELRVKESDRIDATCKNLRSWGAKVEETPNSFTVQPGLVSVEKAESFGDHRIAMACAITGVISGSIELAQPDVVSVSYPQFFEDLRSLCKGLTLIEE